MATTKITDLTAYTDPVNTDVLPIVDVTSDVTKKVSIANVMKNASLGSNTAPGIAFDGDPNTGIYSPGADQVAVTTGGTQRLLIDSAGAVTIAGDLTVNGTTTNINTTNLVIEDKNIILGDVTIPTDVTADGGGITLKGTTDKTINWVDSTDAWTSSEHINIANGKKYYINGTEVLSSTALGSGVLITSSNITDGTIVNADINASAAIAGTKISPDFGSQNRTSTGTSTAASFIPTSSTAPTNGVYLPAANNVAISTNGTGRLFVDSSGNIKVSTGEIFQTSATSYIRVDGGSGSGTGANIIVFGESHASASGRISLSAVGTGAIISSTAGAERMRLTSTGALNFVGAGTAGVTQAVSFNGSAPVNSLVIDSSGRVGLGTSAPVTRCHISESNAGNYASVLLLSNSADAAADRTGIYGSPAPGSAAPYRGGITFWPGASGVMSFHTGNNNAPGDGERMRLTSTGLGIGVTTVSGILHAKAGTNANLVVDNNGGGGALRISALNDAISANTDFQLQGSKLFFVTGGSEKARLDDSGRFLVGTSSARANFFNTSDTALAQVEGTGTTDIAVIKNVDSTAGPSLILGKTRGSTVGSNTLVGNADVLGSVSFQGTDGTQFVEGAHIRAVTDGTVGADDLPTRLVFSTTADGASSPTERMRITQNGFIKITNNGVYNSTTDQEHELRTNVSGNWIQRAINAASSSPFGMTIHYTAAAPNGTGNAFLDCQDTGGSRAVFRSNGGLANYSANNVNLSDRNAKKDIVPAAGTWDCLKEWEIVNFRYKDQPDDADLNMGVIAQQVAESCPEVITVFQEAKEAKEAVLDEEGNELEPALEAQPEKLGVKDQQMMWMAIKALQEAQLRIETLEAEVAALKGA